MSIEKDSVDRLSSINEVLREMLIGGALENILSERFRPLPQRYVERQRMADEMRRERIASNFAYTQNKRELLRTAREARDFERLDRAQQRWYNRFNRPESPPPQTPSQTPPQSNVGDESNPNFVGPPSSLRPRAGFGRVASSELDQNTRGGTPTADEQARRDRNAAEMDRLSAAQGVPSEADRLAAAREYQSQPGRARPNQQAQPRQPTPSPASSLPPSERRNVARPSATSPMAKPAGGF